LFNRYSDCLFRTHNVCLSRQQREQELFTLPPFRPTPIVEAEISLVRLCIFVRVRLACSEPGDCEFWTYCVRRPGDEIATELRTNLLPVRVTQSFINGDSARPGLNYFLDVRADACLPSSHLLCAGQKRVGRTTTKSH